MFKKIILLLIVIFLTSCTNTNENTALLTKKVSYINNEVISYTYEYDNNKIINESVNGNISKTFEYDNNNNISKEISNDIKVFNTYDGKLLVKRETFEKDVLMSSFEFKYENDLKVESIYSSNNHKTVCKYEYDNKNLAKTDCSNDLNESNLEVNTYKDDKLIKTEIFTNGELLQTNTYKYENNQIVEKENYFNKQNYKIIELYEYENSLLSKIYIQDGVNEKVLKEEYFYNKN